jgi:multidrug resistance efflux pump
MAQAVKRGARLAVGIDHPQYRIANEELPAALQTSLASDLNG